jgi:uncharacterized membrane protein
MTNIQRKIAFLIFLAGLFGIIGIGVITAAQEHIEITCAYGVTCHPVIGFDTLLGTLIIPGVTSENFERVRWGMFSLATVVELACVFMLVKTLREQESVQKQNSQKTT